MMPTTDETHRDTPAPEHPRVERTGSGANAGPVMVHRGVTHDLPDRVRSGRDARGRFVSGNGAARTTGLRAGRSGVAAADGLHAEVRRFLDQSLAADEGDHRPPRRQSQHHYRAMLHRQILQLSAALEVRGLFDTRGRLRVSWLGKLESLMREARAFDTSLDHDSHRAPTVSLQTPLATKGHTAATVGSGPPVSGEV